MKLHLGCGGDIKPGYINIDAYNKKADRTMNVKDIIKHFDPGTIDEIYSSHMFEHLDRKEGESFLESCRVLLKVGGTLFLAIPCIDYLVWDWRDGKITDVEFTNSLYGMHRDPYDYHKMGYTVSTITDLLGKYNFSIYKSERGRPNYGPKSPGIMLWCCKELTHG